MKKIQCILLAALLVITGTRVAGAFISVLQTGFDDPAILVAFDDPVLLNGFDDPVLLNVIVTMLPPVSNPDLSKYKKSVSMMLNGNEIVLNGFDDPVLLNSFDDPVLIRSFDDPAIFVAFDDPVLRENFKTTISNLNSYVANGNLGYPLVTVKATMTSSVPVHYPSLTGKVLMAYPANPGFPPADSISFQGNLRDRSGQVNGAVSMKIGVYDAESVGTLLYQENHKVVPVKNGVYGIHIGAGVGTGNGQFGKVHQAVLSTTDLWLDVEVNGEPLLPRRRMTSAPLAILSREADYATQAARADSATTAMTANSAAQALSATSAVNADTVDGKHAAELEESAEILEQIKKHEESPAAHQWSSIANKPAGFNDNIDNDTLASLACQDGNIPAWNTKAATWYCSSAGAGDISAVFAGTGLTGGGSSGDVQLAVAVPLALASSNTASLLNINNSGGPASYFQSSSENGVAVIGRAAKTAPAGFNAGGTFESNGNAGVGARGTTYGTSGKGIEGSAIGTGTGGYFSSTGGPGLVVDKGNAGVGTTTPAAKLDVSGIIRSTSVAGRPVSGAGIEISYFSSSGGDYGIIQVADRNVSPVKIDPLFITASYVTTDRMNATYYGGDSYQFWSPKKYTKFFLPADFAFHTNNDDNTFFIHGDGYLYAPNPPNTGTQDIRLEANLDLPQGATIKKVTGQFYDNSTTSNLTLDIVVKKRPLGSVTSSSLLTLNMPGSTVNSPNMQTLESGTTAITIDNHADAYWLSVSYTGAATTSHRFYGIKVEYEVTELGH